jgi:hypothetical protein
MREPAALREEAAKLRAEADALGKRSKAAFTQWQSLGTQQTAKNQRAERLEVAADMAEQADEIARGVKPVPIRTDVER